MAKARRAYCPRCGKRHIVGSKIAREHSKPLKKQKAKAKRKKKSERVEAYTYGEALRTKDWPFGSSRLGQ